MIDETPVRGRPPVSPEVEQAIEDRLRAGEKPQDIAGLVPGAYLTKVYEIRRRLKRETEAKEAS